MFVRDRKPKRINDPDLSAEEFDQAVAGWSRLDRAIGNVRAIYGYVRKYAHAHPNDCVRLLDAGSKTGNTVIALARLAQRDGIELHITTVERCPRNIETLHIQAEYAGVEINAIERDCLKTGLPTGFDMVTCSSLMHELDTHQTIRLLQSMQTATDGPIVIGDYERSRFSLATVAMASRLLSRSKLFYGDVSTSIRSSYTCDEFKVLAEQALARPIQIRRTPPCRFIATLEEISVIESAIAFA